MRKTILACCFAVCGLWAWDRNGTPIAAGPGDQVVPCFTLHRGCCYMAYVATAGGGVRVCKVSLATGKVLWDVDAASDDPYEGNPQLVLDDNGVIWVAFERSWDNGVQHVVLQSLDTLGSLLLDRQGVLIDTASAKEWKVRLCPNSEGGVSVCWEDWRSDSADVYVARVATDGRVAFSMPVCSLSRERRNPLAISAWGRTTFFWDGSEHDTSGVYVNRLLDDRLQWGNTGSLALPYAQGLRLSAPAQQRTAFPYVAADSLNAYVFPAYFGYDHLGAQHIDTAGRRLLADTLTCLLPSSITLTSDRSAVACYGSNTIPDGDQIVTAMRIDSLGHLPWSDTVVVWTYRWVINPPPRPPAECAAAGDYHGGVVVAVSAWLTWTKMESDIFVVHVDSTGHVGKPQLVCDATGEQSEPAIAQDTTSHGYFLIWDDYRNGSKDIYGARLDSLLQGVEEAVISRPCRLPLSVTPNPAHRTAKVEFVVPMSGRWMLSFHDACGRPVRTAIRDLTSGRVSIFTWDGRDAHGKAVPPGAYFCLLRMAGMNAPWSQVVKVVLL